LVRSPLVNVAQLSDAETRAYEDITDPAAAATCVHGPVHSITVHTHQA